MNHTEVIYAVCILIVLAAAAAGLSKLKQTLKRYGSGRSAG